MSQGEDKEYLSPNHCIPCAHVPKQMSNNYCGEH